MEILDYKDYETAKSNGISRFTAYQRFYNGGWSKQDTISKPVQTKKHGEYAAMAQKNGIKYITFNQRIRNKWSPLDAATIPPKKRTV